MAKDITIKNVSGNTIYYPKTVSDLVYDNESGKTIKTILDDEFKVLNIVLLDKNGNPITSVVEITNGIYIPKSGNPQIGNAPFGATDYIDISGINQIKWHGYLLLEKVSVALAVFYDKDKNFISSIYTRVKNSEPSENPNEVKGDAPYTEYVIDSIPSNAQYARFCSMANGKQNFKIEFRIDDIYKSVNSLSHEIDAVNSSVNEVKGIKDFYPYSVNSVSVEQDPNRVGKYIGRTGVASSFSGGKTFISKPILLKAGETIKCISKGAVSQGLSNVSIISEYLGDDKNYNPLVICDLNLIKEYSYTTTRNIQIALCALNYPNIVNSVSVITTIISNSLSNLSNEINNNKEKITLLEKEIGSPDDMHLQTMGENPIEKVRYEAGMTSIIHSWGFIGDSLCSGELEYYVDTTLVNNKAELEALALNAQNNNYIYKTVEEINAISNPTYKMCALLENSNANSWSVYLYDGSKWVICTKKYSSNTHTIGVSYIDNYDYSWGARMCTLCGVNWSGTDPAADSYNFSVGGQSARGWITANNSRGWLGAKSNPKQAYIIALGVNDSGKSMYPLGDFTDIGTYNPSTDTDTNGATFIGYYAGIIQRLRSIQPKCIIFVTTIPTDNKNDWNEKIRQLPNYFDNIFVLDIQKYGADYSNSQVRNNIYNGGHLSPEGYQYTAYVFATYIDWIIRNNPTTFREVAFIGTGKTRK